MTASLPSTAPRSEVRSARPRDDQRRRAILAALCTLGLLAVPGITGAWTTGGPARTGSGGVAPTTLAQACGQAAWMHLTSTGSQVTSLAGQNDFEFVFAGALAKDVSEHLFRGEITKPAWEAVADFADIRVNDVVMGPGVDPAVWVGSFGVYKGTGGGTLWEPVSTNQTFITALATYTTTVYAAGLRLDQPGAPVGVFAFDAVSNTFVLRGAPSIDTHVVYDLAASPNGTLWMGTDGAGLWRSDDQGSNWGIVNLAGLNDTTVDTLAFDPTDPHRIFAGHKLSVSDQGTPTAGLDMSINDGITWQRRLPDVTAVTAIAASDLRPGLVHAVGWGRGLLYSTDHGDTWRSAATPAGGSFFQALRTIHPRDYQDCELLYAGGADGVWVRDVAHLEYHAAFLPALHVGGGAAALSHLRRTNAPAAPPTPEIAVPRP
jgi:hypothetical protein